MSSYERRQTTPPPPPPPVRVSETGEQVLSLNKMFGPTSRGALRRTLDRLQKDRAGLIENELGIPLTSPLALRLGWQEVSTPGSRISEYELAMQGQMLPAALQRGTQQEMRVRVKVSDSVLKLSHDFHFEVEQSRAQQARQDLERAVNEAVVQAFNPLVAVALQQEIKQKAEQRLQQEQRLRQEQRQLQTVTYEDFAIQTIGSVYAPCSGVY